MSDKPALLPTLLIANERSRHGGEVAPFVAALERGGLTLRRESAVAPDALSDRIRALRHEVAAVVLGGGDGTMHAAAPALLETGLPLGILPLGTANDLARSLSIPNAADDAAAVILRGRTRAIDLGEVNGVPFFNVAHLGLSATVTQRLTQAVKRRLGPLAYPLVAVATILRYARFHATLRSERDQVMALTLQVTVGNGRYYGGGAVVDADASIGDGKLHVYSLEPRARWRLLLMARAFPAGKHDRLEEVRNFTCERLRITTRRPRRITADGEFVARTPAEFRVLPGAVRVFAP